MSNAKSTVIKGVFVQEGFNLKDIKHYSTEESAGKFPVRFMNDWLERGVVFNVMVVQQYDTDNRETRYIPLLYCFRGGNTNGDHFLARMDAARGGFYCFA